MDRQSTIAFILIGVILVFWLYMNSPEPPVNPPKTDDSTKVVTNNDTVKIETKTAAESKSDIAKDEEAEAPASFNNINAPEKVITIETDLALIELTSKGGRFRKFYLKEYETWYHNKIEDTSDFYNSHVQLINASIDGGDFNLVFVTKDGQLVNTKSLDFTADKNNFSLQS
ncbi:MAG: hypothetical protein H6613_14690 [Ignavibacteriales bacterium]|nr:hypothetical protein [Ignavibacteriales bacterium]